MEVNLQGVRLRTEKELIKMLIIKMIVEFEVVYNAVQNIHGKYHCTIIHQVVKNT